jgi:hypothetical protein
VPGRTVRHVVVGSGAVGGSWADSECDHFTLASVKHIEGVSFMRWG